MAAPNRARLTGVVVGLNRPSGAADRWLLRVAVERVEPEYGPQLAEPGDEVDAVTVDPPPELAPGVRVVAQAEYVGGPTRGTFRLHELTVLGA